MSKSKTEDPRKAMLAVRQQVAAELKAGGRIDLLPYNLADKNRALITLQDTLDLAQTKQAKAEDHIVELKQMLEIVQTLSTLVINDANARVLAANEKCAEGVMVQKNLHTEIERLDEGWQDANEASFELADSVNQKTRELDAALATLKVVMGS